MPNPHRGGLRHMTPFVVSQSNHEPAAAHDANHATSLLIQDTIQCPAERPVIRRAVSKATRPLLAEGALGRGVLDVYDGQVEVVELGLFHGPGGSKQRIDCALRLGERDHVADVVSVGENH